MRRFLAMLSLAALGAGALAGAALAKEGGVELASLPIGVEAGEPWTTTILLMGDVPADDPGLRIHHVETGRALTFTARATQNQHAYRVRVVFPEGGLWNLETYSSVDGRAYVVEAGPFRVAGAQVAQASSRAATVSAGFPVWPAVGGGLGLALPAAAGAALFRRRRGGH
jgi:hypothetical protein